MQERLLSAIIALVVTAVGAAANASTSTPAVTPTPTITPFVFGCLGQSNISCYGEPMPTPPDPSSTAFDLFANDYNIYNSPVEPLDSATKVCTSAGGCVAITQTDTVSSDTCDSPAGFGPEQAIGMRLLSNHPSWRVVLVPGANGMRPMAAFLPGADHLDRTTLYGSELFRVITASASGRYAGLFFAQCETNGLTLELANVWASQFTQFVRAWQADIQTYLNIANSPIVFMQCANSDEPYAANVQAAQASINLPYVSMVTTSDLALNPPMPTPGALHFSVPSYRILGQRLADSFDLAQANNASAALLARAAVAQGAGCVQPPAHLVSWWRGEGNAADSVGTNAGVLQYDVTFTTGKVGQGFDLAAPAAPPQFVKLPDDVFPSSGPAKVPFSFDLWFKTSSSGVILGEQGASPPATIGVTAPNGWVPMIYVGTDGKLYVQMIWTGAVDLISPGVVNDGAFHFLAVTYDGTTENAYLDGGLLGSKRIVPQAYATAHSYQLGTGFTSLWPNTNGGWFSFSGVIDEVELYDQALSETDVAALFKAGSAGKCAPRAVAPVIWGVGLAVLIAALGVALWRFLRRQPGDALVSQDKRRADHILCLFVWVGIFWYLAAMPRNLGSGDESCFLVEAKRIAHGEVLYKDIFYWSTPVADWIIALAFRIFGVDIRTAKLLMATLHGLTGVVGFLTARRLGVRRGIALWIPIAYIALCQAPWPYASPHWFSTFVMALLLFVLTDNAWARRSASAIVPGMVTGVLISVQHNKGIVVAAGVCGLFVLNSVLGWRYDKRWSQRDMVRRLLYFAAGSSIVVIPVILVVIATAGWETFLDQILWTVIGGKYREYNHPSYGQVGAFTADYARYTLPLLLEYLPIVVGIGILRASYAWAWRTSRAEFVKLLVLIVVTAASLLSVAYYADFIHLAFVAPVFFIFWAETLEALIKRCEPVIRHASAWAGLVIVGLGCSLVLQLHGNMVRAWQEYPYPHETAFGHVDFATEEEIRLVDLVRTLLREAGAHEFFAYPVNASLYLTAGADNPTPYQLLIPGFHPAHHVERALAILKAKRLPYVYATTMFLKADDVILNYIRRHYECVEGPRFCVLLHRRGDESTD